ncbi:MAG TPA: hypothetical protein VEH27_01705 [Methylomirabilota bacterium]|nr:hypothetical protein [Methylomirabilota bacterium]
MLRAAVLLILVAITAFASRGATFQIDPARSSITMSGTLAGFTIQEQAPGSLQTRFEGPIQANVTPTSITFPGGSVVDAQTNGSWQPLPGGMNGRDWADYGAQATIPLGGTARGAVRNIVLDVTSGTIPISNGSFDAQSMVFSFPTNGTATLDYNASIFGLGSEPLSGTSTNKTATRGTITEVNGKRTLTLAIDTTFSFAVMNPNDSQVRFVGSVVAVEAEAAARPAFTRVELIGASIRLYVRGGDATVKLQTTSNFSTWSDRTAEVTTEGDTRIYTVPITSSREFFRLVDI